MTTETRKRRKYAVDFNRDAVALVTEQGYIPSETARSLGIGDSVPSRNEPLYVVVIVWGIVSMENAHAQRSTQDVSCHTHR
jgi:hypothetical protein